MKEIKQHVKAGYWESTDLETLHKMSRMWLSDFGFYKDELHFMESLLQKHFVYFFEKERVDTVQPLAKRLSTTMTTQLSDLKKEVSLHEVDLARMLKSGDKLNGKSYRATHAKLNERIWQFEEDLKLVKKDLFKIAEQVLREEKMKFLTESSN
jgi:hypothetical protein